jgi:2,4-dienoyl-CoA reductase-like NADH-dependent reductase (Old Yellow Enzyme family)
VVERPASRNDPKVPFFFGPALAGWQRVIENVHEAGGRMGPQLWHVGAVPSRAQGWAPDGAPESPSGLVAAGQSVGKAMTESDIADTISAFAAAAAEAQRLGFDVAEIHAAHGYLIDEFFWDATNQRNDAWGGATIADRSRFAVEVLRQTRTAVGPEFPIIVRVSQWKLQDYGARLASSPQEMEAWLRPLVDAGADILHCSQRRFWEAEFPEIDGAEGLNFAGWAKKLTGVPTVSVGSVGLTGDAMSSFAGETSQASDLERLVNRMEKGEFDLIAVGRALLKDPLWLQKIRMGRPTEAFSPASFQTLY